MKCYLSYLFGLTLLFTNLINARSIETLSDDDKNLNNGDKYYFIYVNNENPTEYKVFYDAKIQKREESQIHIESLVDDINKLIIENKDTYKNPEKLDEIEKASQQEKLSKKDEDQEVRIYDESDFVYPISSFDDSVVLYAYLSETLAKELPSKFENIVECSPNEGKIVFTEHSYDIDEILSETKWSNVTVRENANRHLSLISQGKINGNANNAYDENFYYPSTAGKDVDIIVMDTSFNFNYSEFSNTDDRTVKCVGVVQEKQIEFTDKCDVSPNPHGEQTSDCAAGLVNGVANRANVYGLALNIGGPERTLLGIQYIAEHMIRPHKTVISLSFGTFESKNLYFFKHFEKAVNKINQKGGIVVAAAGNNGKDLEKYRETPDNKNKYFIPCEFSETICVGGYNNIFNNLNDVYKISDKSNYGKNVDIYAPFYVNTTYVKNDKLIKNGNGGTSFSTPIVSGIVASIISENEGIEYTKESMLSQLLENGKDLTFELPNGDIGILANNGKHSIYTNKPEFKKNPSNECYGQELGYPCCNDCHIVLVDSTDKWGVESNHWCGIRYNCESDKHEWYSQDYGLPPCDGCTVESESTLGKLGYENNTMCGIRFSC